MDDTPVGGSLALRRSRRSTAGNRMEAALAEMAALQPDPELEGDEDKDFVGPAEEEEIFDSDFQSTDEEAEPEEETAGEKEIVAEEKQARKAARQRAAKAVESRTSAAIPKPGNADATIKPRRRVGNRQQRLLARQTSNATSLKTPSKRKSQRQSTMLSSQILGLRLRNAEERKAAMPKRVKDSSVIHTQAELLARALDTEEGNISSHRNYLEEEEEKRKRARVVKQKLTGPVLSWVSRVEDEPVPSGPLPYTKVVLSDSQADLTYQRPLSDAHTGEYSIYEPDVSAARPSSHVPPVPQLFSRPQQMTIEKVTKNYLEHRVDEGMPQPNWNETMSAVFGAHVNWDEVKVYSGKHRPLSRPTQKCPITGRTAIYCDPRSGVPYSSVDAFKTLSRVLSHEYVWNDELQCYTADEKAVQLEPEPDDLTGSDTPPIN